MFKERHGVFIKLNRSALLALGVFFSVLPLGCGKKNPVAVNPYRVVASVPAGAATGVKIAGSYAYVAGQANGLEIWDVSNPVSPNQVSIVPPPTGATVSQVFVSSFYAFLACVPSAGSGDTAFAVVGISDPHNPTVLGRCRLYQRSGYDVLSRDGCAYVAEGTVNNVGYLQVLDVHDRLQPYVIATCSLQNSSVTTLSYEAGNRVLWTAGAEPCLTAIDVSICASPTVIGSCNLPGAARDISLFYPYAYVANTKGLEIIYIGNPRYSYSVARYPLPDSGVGSLAGAGSVFVTTNRAYVGGLGRLHIFDIQDPTKPVLLGSVDIPESALDICVSGTYAYIATGTKLVVVQLPS